MAGGAMESPVVIVLNIGETLIPSMTTNTRDSHFLDGLGGWKEDM
jgi:hypothetical protein